mmetsp:Transcript_29499/g.81009  ORF Transcript_29499/g.81009 Transcript_29499/m.81009 type:complete len:213 (+) Transcript_29499:681-1319(+)
MDDRVAVGDHFGQLPHLRHHAEVSLEAVETHTGLQASKLPHGAQDPPLVAAVDEHHAARLGKKLRCVPPYAAGGARHQVGALRQWRQPQGRRGRGLFGGRCCGGVIRSQTRCSSSPCCACWPLQRRREQLRQAARGRACVASGGGGGGRTPRWRAAAQPGGGWRQCAATWPQHACRCQQKPRHGGDPPPRPRPQTSACGLLHCPHQEPLWPA